MHPKERKFRHFDFMCLHPQQSFVFILESTPPKFRGKITNQNEVNEVWTIALPLQHIQSLCKAAQEKVESSEGQGEIFSFLYTVNSIFTGNSIQLQR